jgi:maltooligosyltrehalose trehalohydrolase
LRHPAATSVWQPGLGAWRESDGVRFRVWAPHHEHIDVVWSVAGAEASSLLDALPDGTHVGWIPAISVGIRYRFRLPDGRLLPDPASRFQPDGVHGPSEIVDPCGFNWTDSAWSGLPLADAIIYELHVGTFTLDGTFDGVTSRLEYLKQLGITAIELMPVAEFAGRRNWGYDGVDLFAPSHHYGRPDDLRRLVNEAHRLGLAVILDVVYNHFGPDGAYASTFSPYYFTDRHQTPWGRAPNVRGPQSEHVREFFLQNALHWIHEYHVDGLRLDATQTLHDDEFLRELSDTVHAASAGRALVIAEDDRNLARLAMTPERGGDGLDALWADDFHHQIRRAVARDADGYYRSYSGAASDIAETIRSGWFFAGQVAPHTGEPRGTDPQPLGLEQFIFCVQNHDQVGNRALGDRLHHGISPAAYRAVVALLLCAPETPLLFMGQEWGTSSPFLFFTDHEAELGRAITAGRRTEFARFEAFRDPAVCSTIPDPQELDTFRRSRLNWSELSAEPHASLFRLHQALITFRRTTAATNGRQRTDVQVEALDESTIALCRVAEGSPVIVVARLEGGGRATVQPCWPPAEITWTTVLTTNDEPFSAERSRRPAVIVEAAGISIDFDGPAAVLLRGTPRERGRGNGANTVFGASRST